MKSLLLLPDVGDLNSVVGDYVDTYLPHHRNSDQREKIIRQCTPIFEQLMYLVQDALASGIAEEIVFAAFMRDLASASTRSSSGIDGALNSSAPRRLH